MSNSTRAQRELVSMDGLRFELMGSVGSQRGVQLLAFDVMTRVEDHITTGRCSFSFLPHMTPNAQLSVDRRSYQPLRPLNYFASGVSMVARGGAIAGVLCIFNEHFMASLLEIERDLQFDKIGLLTSIDSRRLVCLGQEMLRESLSPGFGGALRAEAMGIETALEIIRCDGARQRSKGTLSGGLAPWQMRRLEDYIRAHLADELTLSGLAELLGISIRHLSRVVKQTKGVSVHRWVADLRIAEAQRLLSETNLPLHDIARRIAFSGAGAFSTAFRAASGFSPSDFRRLTRRFPLSAAPCAPSQGPHSSVQIDVEEPS